MSNRGLTSAVAVGLLLCLYASRPVLGQGGAPMLTDDPGTPASGHWENNFAITFERRSHEVAFEAPTIDLNYGIGDRIQLTLQTSAALLKRSGHGLIGGLGSTEAALKWRFLEQNRDGVSMSTAPRIIFNVLQSSVRRGLADDGTRVQLPVEVARKIGRLDLDFELGALVRTVGRSEWLYGIVGGIDLVPGTALMAELHGSARSNFSRDFLTVNIGLRQKLSDSCILITSLGHEVRSPNDEPLALIGYLGLQLPY